MTKKDLSIILDLSLILRSPSYGGPAIVEYRFIVSPKKPYVLLLFHLTKTYCFIIIQSSVLM